MAIPLMFLLFILSLSLVGLLLKKKEDIFFILMTVVFSVTWIADELMLIPHFFTWTIELLILLLFVIFLLPKFIFFRKIETTPIFKYLFFIIIYGLIGSLIYVVSLNSTLLGLRSFFKYAFLFLIFINAGVSEKKYKQLFFYWLLIIGFQPLLGLFQALFLGKTDDSVHGTITDTGILSMLLIIFIICLIDLINRKTFKNHILYIFIFLSFTVIPILGEVKAFFYFLPIILAIRYIDVILSLQLRKITFFLIPFIISILLFQNFYGINVFGFSQVNTSDFLFSQGAPSVTGDGNTIAISMSERFLSLLATYNFLSNDLLRIFFGEGLGSHIFTYETRQNFIINTESSYILKFSISKFIANMGIVGLALFYAMLANISYYAYKSSFMIKNQFFIDLYRTIPAFSILFCLSMLYTDPFEDYIQFSYWFFVSSIAYIPSLKKL
tara:strand:+ start:2498 stop:3817 length:1320 start_codon:yes stop_codon:yes gene_type:complete